MAKLKGKGVVLAGLAAGAASFLSKKENRDKVMEYVNQAKTKMNESGGVQGLMEKIQNATNTGSNGAKSDASGPSSSAGEFVSEGNENTKEASKEQSVEEKIETAAQQTETSTSTDLEGNHFVEEGGALTLIDTYNEMQEESHKESNNS